MRAAEGRQSSDMESDLVPAPILQRLVVRPRAAFRRGPGDDPVRVLDVTRLAVHAIGGVDLQAPSAGAVVDHLVDTCRTETLAGVAVFPGAAPRADAGVGDLQVYGLVLVVHVAGEEHERQPIAWRQGALYKVPVGRGEGVELLETRPVGGVLQCPRRVAGGEGLPDGVDESPPHAALERRLEIAHAPQLLAADRCPPESVEARPRAARGDVLSRQRAAA